MARGGARRLAGGSARRRGRMRRCAKKRLRGGPRASICRTLRVSLPTHPATMPKLLVLIKDVQAQSTQSNLRSVSCAMSAE
eukprot:5005966-Pyramimonas_sp.AAC.1